MLRVWISESVFPREWQHQKNPEADLAGPEVRFLKALAPSSIETLQNYFLKKTPCHPALLMGSNYPSKLLGLSKAKLSNQYASAIFEDSKNRSLGPAFNQLQPVPFFTTSCDLLGTGKSLVVNRLINAHAEHEDV